MIYFIQRRDTAIKIGMTASYHSRMSSLKVEHGELELLGLMDGGRDIEKTLHRQFSDARIGKTEWFKPTPALLSFIAQHTHLDIPATPITSIRIDLGVHQRLQALKALTKKGNMSQLLDEIIEKAYPNIDELVSGYQESERLLNEMHEKILGNKPQ